MFETWNMEFSWLRSHGPMNDENTEERERESIYLSIVVLNTESKSGWVNEISVWVKFS